MKNNVVVIIINYQTSHLMKRLLDTIQEDSLDIKIVIVDNGSTEDSYQVLKDLNDARLVIIRSQTNIGFTGGINLALNYALANYSFKYFYLLNPDAFNKPGVIKEFVDILEACELAACVSPQILYLDGKPWYSGAQIETSKGIVLNNENSYSNRVCQVDVFSGCACLFSTSKVIDTGMFNEGLFMYYDEVELSLRLKSRGYQILYNPNIRIYHDVSYTTRNLTHVKAYYMSRNRMIVFGRSMSNYAKAYCLIYGAAFFVKHGKFKNAYFHLKGYIDYKKGRLGPLISNSI